MYVPGLSTRSALFLDDRLNQLKKGELQDDRYKQLGVAKVFPDANPAKSTAGGDAVEEMVKRPGKRTKALLAAIKAGKVNRGHTPSKELVGVLNDQLLMNNPYAAALLKRGAAGKVSRDIYKKYEVYFENEFGKQRDRYKDALAEHKSDLEQVVNTLQNSTRYQRVSEDFVKKFGTFEEKKEHIEACLEALDLKKNKHPFGKAEDPAPAYSPTSPPNYAASEDQDIDGLARKLRNSLARVKSAHHDMEEAAVFRDIYAALRETQRNGSYRSLAVRISPAMRTHLATAFGIFGALTMILSFPLMVGPLGDWIRSIVHHHSSDQQQQQQQS